ncbi:peptidase [Streptomyces sp. AJS327]|uniref:trypsin-like serine peptidase n=1 Tax=Streptomyces sp. AJS327 TaxID=2545265 RepID=UPI0015DE70B0|nr:peptidase [Streptomyces sp. AJS327]MBA0054167.1 peptidase [Streptomyces sp. AJS327]
MTASAALLATGALAAPAAASSSPAANAPDSGKSAVATAPASVTETQDPERLQEFWTAERMRDATPLEQLAPEAVTKLGQQPRKSVASGAERTVEGVTPAAPERGVGPADFPQAGGEWTGGGDVVTTSGRVFFTYDGRQASCSGNAVTSENSSTVMTAGHCVKMDGNWHTDWVFVPGYDNGEAPHGKWTASETLTTPQWEASEDINYDVGAAVVGELDGKKLTDVVGGQGLAFNGEHNQDMYAFGFPAADPYDGERLIYCSGTTFKDPLLSNDHGMDCDMTGGSSGGPWFTDFDESTGQGLQSSVNSFGYVFLPNTMFGPHFGADAETLYQTAQSS